MENADKDYFEKKKDILEGGSSNVMETLKKEFGSHNPSTTAPVAPRPQLPSVGRIVIFHLEEQYRHLNNDATFAPAIIVRVNDESNVNLRVMVDSNTNPIHRTGVVMSAELEPGQCWWPQIK